MLFADLVLSPRKCYICRLNALTDHSLHTAYEREQQQAQQHAQMQAATLAILQPVAQGAAPASRCVCGGGGQQGQRGQEGVLCGYSKSRFILQ